MILNYFSANKVIEYEKFVANNKESEDHILEIEEHEELGQGPYDYINGVTMAKVLIEKILAEKKMTFEELLKNRTQRNEIIRIMRRNSSLNLREIGELLGGISESQVGRIVN